MKPISKTKMPAAQAVKDIRRATRKHYGAEENIRIVLERLRGASSIAELCRKEGIAQCLYYKWSRSTSRPARSGLPEIRHRRATSDEVKDLRVEAGC